MIYSNCLLDTFYCAHVCGQNSVNPVAARSSDTHHLVTVGQRELAHIQILQLQWLNPLSQDLNTQASAEEATCCSGEKLTPSPVRAAPCCRAGRWLASGAGTHAHAHTHTRAQVSQCRQEGLAGRCVLQGEDGFFFCGKSHRKINACVSLFCKSTRNRNDLILEIHFFFLVDKHFQSSTRVNTKIMLKPPFTRMFHILI